MGSRSQTSRTYLEREYESFANASVDDLIKHALKALAASLSADTELDTKSASISIVGKDTPYTLLEGADLQKYLDEIEVEGEGDMAEEGEIEDVDA
jgi:20S proteasome subunit alpha 6